MQVAAKTCLRPMSAAPARPAGHRPGETCGMGAQVGTKERARLCTGGNPEASAPGACLATHIARVSHTPLLAAALAHALRNCPGLKPFCAQMSLAPFGAHFAHRLPSAVPINLSTCPALHACAGAAPVGSDKSARVAEACVLARPSTSGYVDSVFG